jgi:hypothetical protein
MHFAIKTMTDEHLNLFTLTQFHSFIAYSMFVPNFPLDMLFNKHGLGA